MSDNAQDNVPDRPTPSDVQRFERLMSVMTSDQREKSCTGLPTIAKLPDDLANSIAPSSHAAARSFLAWLARWKERHVERDIRAAMPSRLPPASIGRSPGPARLGPPSGSQDASLAAFSKLVCQSLLDRSRELERSSSEVRVELKNAVAGAKNEHRAAVAAADRADQGKAWSHIHRAIGEIDAAAGHMEMIAQQFGEAAVIARGLTDALPCHEEVKQRLDHVFATYALAAEINPAPADLWQVHAEVIRLARDLDVGEVPDPSVPCVDLSQTGDFWNWLWKQVRGGANGDTNPPGWLPVDPFALIQAAFGTITYINMEPDGDIHINLSAVNLPGFPSVNALTNWANPDGQLVCEIPLCDRGWFTELPDVCVGKLAFVVGKWMLEVWNGWYELHPLYWLSVYRPVIVG